MKRILSEITISQCHPAIRCSQTRIRGKNPTGSIVFPPYSVFMEKTIAVRSQLSLVSSFSQSMFSRNNLTVSKILKAHNAMKRCRVQHKQEKE